MMNRFKLVLLLIFFTLSFSLSTTYADEKEPVRDYLYSEEYFDYLIECANDEYQKKQEQLEQEISIENNDITAFEFDEIIESDITPFKLRIEENNPIEKYSETFKKPETKIIIPTSEKFSFTYNATQYVNKNYTDGRRMASGIEYSPFKKINFATGVETNYRDVDQNPLSRKLYFTPSLKINDYLTVSFLNKVNVLTHTSDHDIGLYLAPFKTKAVDFKMFTGITKESSGRQSQSASFYTNFYFF